MVQRAHNRKIKQRTGLFGDSEETKVETHPLAYTNGCDVCRDVNWEVFVGWKQDSKVEDILSDIGKGHGLLKLPNENEVSDEAIDFLKGCFAGKAMDRLIAQMLLNHPFVAGLGEDNEDNEEELPMGDFEEKCCSISTLSLSDYKADDEHDMFLIVVGLGLLECREM
ncbi:hypothetical protein HYC85_028674 [Camellia sinensis]|uniref:Protein kinase domain-containing protein n=1 Tax=Camellia sinensis TaxID=4442 RepID=A0A7J7FVU6_CAMSI|nr:hypothetical protein HYC85_028674 [Camellia sinensis]